MCVSVCAFTRVLHNMIALLCNWLIMSITNNELNVVSNLTNLISMSGFVQQPVSEKLCQSLLRSFIENWIHLLVFQHLALAKLGLRKRGKVCKICCWSNLTGTLQLTPWAPGNGHGLQLTLTISHLQQQPPSATTRLHWTEVTTRRGVERKPKQRVESVWLWRKVLGPGSWTTDEWFWPITSSVFLSTVSHSSVAGRRKSLSAQGGRSGGPGSCETVSNFHAWGQNARKRHLRSHTRRM